MMNVQEIIGLIRGLERITPDNVDNELDCYNGVRVENGYTKVVIISKNSEDDFVIKIPRADTVRYNYCERESHVYERACKWGLEFLFAKTERAGVIDKKNHIYYYKQTKVNNIGYWDSNEDEDFNILDIPIIRRQLEKILEKQVRSKYANSCSMVWYGYVLKHYGPKTLEKLILFLNTAKVNDLRSDNVGFKNGKPIIIDYSGFHGSGRY